MSNAAGGDNAATANTTVNEHRKKSEKHSPLQMAQDSWKLRRAKYILFAKMGILLFICVVYFGTTLTLNLRMSPILSAAPNEANYSDMRRMLSRNTMLNLRLLATGTSFGGFEVTEADVDRVLVELNGAHEALLYGSTDHQIPGFLKGLSSMLLVVEWGGGGDGGGDGDGDGTGTGTGTGTEDRDGDGDGGGRW